VNGIVTPATRTRLTKEQLRLLPMWLRRYEGVEEDGNTPLGKREWQRLRLAYLGLAKAPKQRGLHNSITHATLTETIRVMWAALDFIPKGAIRDQYIQAGTVLETLRDRAKVNAVNASKRLERAREEGKITYKATGRPRITLLVRDPRGNEHVVSGYAEAAELLGTTARSLTTRVSIGHGRAILGRHKDGKDCWTVEKVGTEDATLHEPCQKPENEAGEKSGQS